MRHPRFRSGVYDDLFSEPEVVFFPGDLVVYRTNGNKVIDLDSSMLYTVLSVYNGHANIAEIVDSDNKIVVEILSKLIKLENVMTGTNARILSW